MTGGTLEIAERLIGCLDPNVSQGSIGSQAQDCAGVVYALGYHDLASLLTKISSGLTVVIHPNGKVDVR